jgi:hypothetical protein
LKQFIDNLPVVKTAVGDGLRQGSVQSIKIAFKPTNLLGNCETFAGQ